MGYLLSKEEVKSYLTMLVSIKVCSKNKPAIAVAAAHMLPMSSPGLLLKKACFVHSLWMVNAGSLLSKQPPTEAAFHKIELNISEFKSPKSVYGDFRFDFKSKAINLVIIFLMSPELQMHIANCGKSKTFLYK